jgi:WD40 repeat protein
MKQSLLRYCFFLFIGINIYIFTFTEETFAKTAKCDELVLPNSKLRESIKNLIEFEKSFSSNPEFHKDFAYKSQMIEKFNSELKVLLSYLNIDTFELLNEERMVVKKPMELSRKSQNQKAKARQDEIERIKENLVFPHEIYSVSHLGGTVYGLAISPDLNYLATADAAEGTKITEFKTGKALYTVADSIGAVQVLISGDNQRLVNTADGGKAIITELSSGNKIGEVFHFKSKTEPTVISKWLGFFRAKTKTEPVVISQLLADDNSKTLVTVSHLEGIVKLSDLQTGQLIYEIPQSEFPSVKVIRGIDLSKDGKYLAIGFRDGEVRVFDLLTRKLVFATEYATKIQHIKLSEDGKILIVVGASNSTQSDNFIKVIDIPSEKTKYEVSQITSPGDYSFSDDNKILIVTSNGYCRVVELQSGTELYSTPKKSNQTMFATLSQNREILAIAEFGQETTVYNIKTNSILYNIPDNGKNVKIAMSPNNSVLAINTNNGGIALFDLYSGLEIFDYSDSIGFVFSLDFTADSRYLIINGGKVKVLDTRYR